MLDPSKDIGKSLSPCRMGLGCMGMSEFYGPCDFETAIATISAALEVGIRLLDTADMYGMGANEGLVGEALKGRRMDAFVTTKVGITRNPTNPSFKGVCGKPDYIKRSCERSLRRLKTEYIDLYYLHRIDPTVPIEESIGAMKELVDEGKVIYLGLSEARPNSILRANKVHPLAAIQNECSLLEPCLDVIHLCETISAKFIAHSPLARGLLSGTITNDFLFPTSDSRSHLPWFTAENLEHNLELVHDLKSFACQKGCSLAQLALAWLCNISPTIIPIPGMDSPSMVKHNISALYISLTEEESVALRRIVTSHGVAGTRYPKSVLEALGEFNSP